MSTPDRPRLRTRLAVLYAMSAVVLGAGPVAMVGLGAWSGGSTQEFGAPPVAGPSGNTGTVLLAATLGLLAVAIAAGPIGWALAGRAVRPLRELTAAAGGAAADNLPGHGQLGRYQEYAELSATLAGLYARLDSAYAAQRRFVADASHELRTPLTVQRALIQVALADPYADVTSLRAVCQEVLQLGEQQERLVAALLALARGQQATVAAQPVDLAALATEALSVRRTAAEARQLTVRADLHPHAVVPGDPILLASLIGNLLDNAIRHNVDDGRVDLAVSAAAGRTVLTIANSGPVVPADEVARILQPFQRLDSSSSPSSGLGLAIVRAITAGHSAGLRVQPNADGGLTVVVAFPSPGQRTFDAA
ncbi:MAG: HAMP domain-containing histidine kinase [Hamadaea sp.]|uniref:sensor histidine kinase n=1 Tax=Hamadaea sp. TaxID=2024425 RepID=UPI0018522EDB|nr:HAMP domain-containing sensor histidine kinase [Hamadaea sp.]NUR69318.1 HAMP domain-containing histidine kinase [Hamadaea sp.]NUT21978.1 HAMP domain-containing histidine kinase [Hamadaea sp.]